MHFGTIACGEYLIVIRSSVLVNSDSAGFTEFDSRAPEEVRVRTNAYADNCCVDRLHLIPVCDSLEATAASQLANFCAKMERHTAVFELVCHALTDGVPERRQYVLRPLEQVNIEAVSGERFRHLHADVAATDDGDGLRWFYGCIPVDDIRIHVVNAEVIRRGRPDGFDIRSKCGRRIEAVHGEHAIEGCTI